MNLNVIRTLTMRAKTEGVPESTADLNKLKAAHEGLAKVTDTSAKWQLSLADAVSKAERRFNTSLRAQQDFEKVQRQMNLAVAQNPALQERANAVLALARTHFDQASRGSHAYGAAMQAASSQAQAFAGRIGPLGGALSGIGPAGLVAAAGIGVVVLALHAMVTAANDLANTAGKMVDFAETTGLTTTQLQALQKAAAFVGIDADKLGTNFEKFTAQLEELRRGTGGLFDGLNRLNPALTRQLAETRSAGDAWDVFSKAVASANREQAVALSRAAFGRGGAGMVRLAGATTEAGGLAGLEEGLGRVNTLTTEQLKRWDDLGDKINYTTKLARQNIVSIFTDPVLESQLKFSEGLLVISQAARNFSLSGDWSRFISDLNSSGLQKFLAVAGSIPIVGGFATAARLATMGHGTTPPEPPATSFNDRFGAATGSLKKDDPNRLDRFNAADLQRQIAAMGEAASSADKLRLAEAQLGIAFKENAITGEQYRLALTALRSAEKLSDMRDTISALGSAATVTELYTFKIAQLTRQLELGRISKETYDRAVSSVGQDRDLQTQRDRISALGDAATETDRYTLRVGELQKQLDQGRISQETFNQAVLNANPIFKAVRDNAIGFTNDLVSGLMDGKTMMDALAGAATNLSKKLANMAVENAIMGAMSGNPVQMAMAAAQAIGAVMLDMFAKSTQEAKKEAERQERLIGARREADAFMDRRAGTSGSKSSTMQRDIWEMQQIANKFWVEKDVTGARKVEAQQHQMIAETFREFQGGWSGMVDEIGRGSGVFSEARANVSQFADQMKSFIKDTMAFVAGEESYRTAQRAAQGALLAMLSGAPKLSEVATEMQRIAGTAAALQKALTDVGMSADAAAIAIASGVTAALDKLRASFINDINREINDATGKGYLNEFADLSKRRGTLSADATALGADPALITRWFQVQAQKLVAEAGLTADGFSELIRLFPELSGVVTNTVEALRSAQDLADARLSIEDRLFAIGNDPNSLDGQLAAMRRTQERERIEETRAGGDLLLDLSRLHYLEELKLREDFNQKTIEETKRAEKERMDALTSAARNIVDYLAGLKTGADSPLAPSARLTAAQSAYQATLGLAQGGNLDALGRITRDAETFRTAAQAMFGSAAGYQAIFNQIQQQLLALPAVSTSTDLVVQALREVLGAVQGTTAAVGTGNTLTTTGNTLTTTGNTLTTTGNTLTTTGNTLTTTGNIIAAQIEAYTLQTRQSVEASNALTGATNNLLTAIRDFSQAIRDFADSQVTLLDAIKGLNNTSTQQLALLNSHLTNAAVSIPGYTGPGGGVGRVTTDGLTANNSMLQALNKIVINTGMIVANTHSIRAGVFKYAPQESKEATATGTAYATGAFAQGGLAPPFTNFMYGEHHPQGPFFGRTGAQPLAITPQMPVWNGGANDNSALLARIDRLTSKVEALEKELRYNSDVTVQGNDVNRSGHAKTAGAVGQQTERNSADARQERANPRRRSA